MNNFSFKTFFCSTLVYILCYKSEKRHFKSQKCFIKKISIKISKMCSSSDRYHNIFLTPWKYDFSEGNIIAEMVSTHSETIFENKMHLCTPSLKKKYKVTWLTEYVNRKRESILILFQRNIFKSFSCIFDDAIDLSACSTNCYFHYVNLKIYFQFTSYKVYFQSCLELVERNSLLCDEALEIRILKHPLEIKFTLNEKNVHRLDASYMRPEGKESSNVASKHCRLLPKRFNTLQTLNFHSSIFTKSMKVSNK